MPFKKLEDMDYYELLGLNRDAAPEDIAEACRATAAAYAPGALASYGLVSDEEKTFMIERIEKARRTLLDPEARAVYDGESSPGGSPSPVKAAFRKTVQALEIQDVKEKKSFGEKLRSFFGRKTPPID